MIQLYESLLQKKQIAVNDLSNGKYSTNKYKRIKTPMPRSDFSNYSGAYTIVKGTISVTGTNNVNRRKKASRIMLHLGHAQQKSVTHLQAMQKILVFSC